MSRSRLSYSLTPFEYLKNASASSKKQSFRKDSTSLMMDTFLYRTHIENSVGIHHSEFYCIKITSFKSSNMRIYQDFSALDNRYYFKKSLGNHFWIIGQLPNGPTPSYTTEWREINWNKGKKEDNLGESSYLNLSELQIKKMTSYIFFRTAQ